DFGSHLTPPLALNASSTFFSSEVSQFPLPVICQKTTSLAEPDSTFFRGSRPGLRGPLRVYCPPFPSKKMQCGRPPATARRTHSCELIWPLLVSELPIRFICFRCFVLRRRVHWRGG